MRERERERDLVKNERCIENPQNFFVSEQARALRAAAEASASHDRSLVRILVVVCV